MSGDFQIVKHTVVVGEMIVDRGCVRRRKYE